MKIDMIDISEKEIFELLQELSDYVLLNPDMSIVRNMMEGGVNG